MRKNWPKPSGTGKSGRPGPFMQKSGINVRIGIIGRLIASPSGITRSILVMPIQASWPKPGWQKAFWMQAGIRYSHSSNISP
jgi:hypothetical protein